jgi:tetratricopeptide (TPR) repeat protein
LITSTLEYPQARFQFSHELVRQAVLTRLSVARRQRLHLDIADAIERVFADSPEERVGDLVHHLFQAGTAADGAKTARYAAMAARRALQQGALTEAEELYRRALDVLGTTPQTAARSLQELKLQLGLGQTYITTRGYTFRETSATYDRAAALGEQLGEPLQVVLAYAGQFAQPLLRGEIKVAQSFADRIRELAERSQKKQTALSFACHFQGCSRYHGGELEMAREYLGQAIALYREEDHREMPQETGLEAQSYMALTLWQLGMIDTARAQSKAAIAHAERLGKPFALAHTRYFASHLNVMLRNPVACQKIAELGIEQAQDQSLALFLHIFRMLRGWALAQQGHCEEGIASARAGLASFKAEGYGLSIGAFLGFLAEAIAQSGEMAEALATVEEGISAMGDQMIDRPHLLWLRGEFQTRQSAVDLAEASFRESIAVANRLGARTLALRASTSLGRLLAAQGRKDEARGVVAPLLKEFTEGFDTRDLIEAKEIGG